MPKVLNAKIFGTGNIATRVYVGRPSVWGNPFVIGKDGDRDTVIAKYEGWLLGQPDLVARLPSLRGKNLCCWCAPKKCHAEVLIRQANRG